MNPASRMLRKWRYGDEIIVVSGLPRSGTSMLMKMLAAGGVPVLTDELRTSDVDNPGGYFEHERIKDLESEQDKSWLRQARGKAMKVISHLLKALPDNNYYRVILIRRDLEEIIQSQNIMLENRNEPNPVADRKAMEFYGNHLVDTKVYARRRPNFDMLEVHYRLTLADPLSVSREIDTFLGGGLDVQAMAAVVNHDLYRNRNTGAGQA